jgi:NDP-sugar pyrophosphorylase family protein
LDGGKVSVYEVAADRFHSFHSPDKIKQFESAGNGCGNGVSPSPPADLGTHEGNAVVVVPAAGDGSRFRTAGFLKPKPFIDVLGRPMIEHVLGNVVPAGASVHVILRRSHAESERALTKQLLDRGIGIHYVDRLTEGTACTLLLAQRAIDNDSPLLIANSDQYVDFDVSAFVRDCLDRQLDGSILIFKEPTRDTKWSYAKIDSGGLVLEVAEKKAISDLATVGIYLFRRGRDFIRGAIDMIANNDRVNNEFYTCPVYNYLIRSGARIGVFEIPKSSMHGLGTPADLAEFIQGRSHTDERPLASH